MSDQDKKVTSDEVIGHGVEAARLALEYISAIIPNPREASEDERRAIVVALCSCIASLNTKLLTNCPQDVYRESQDLILRLMEGASQGVARHRSTILTPDEGKE